MAFRILFTAATVFVTTASAGKRGLAYNDGIDISGFSNSQVSWSYNWDSTTNADVNYGEFVPMLWGTQDYHTDKWSDNAEYWLARGSQHLLGFNEPDRPDQANMSPGDAVNAWWQHMEPFHGRARLGAPACQGCNIDFVPVHWYNDHSQEDDLASFLYTLTEFKGFGSENEQIDFLKQAMHLMDSVSCVERYSYFGINYGSKDMTQGDGPNLTDLGQYYGYN